MKSAYIHLYSGNACGKTAILCRLLSLLNDKECYVIIRLAWISNLLCGIIFEIRDCLEMIKMSIFHAKAFIINPFLKIFLTSLIAFRFVGLTQSSNYAHELWHSICMNLCILCGRSTTKLQNSFHLSSTLSIFKAILENLDRPLFLFLDDVHLIKFGRSLSIVDAPFKNLLPNLILIATSNTNMSIPFMPPPSSFQIPEFCDLEMLNFLKHYCNETRKLNTGQLDRINYQVILKKCYLSSKKY